VDEKKSPKRDGWVVVKGEKIRLCEGKPRRGTEMSLNKSASLEKGDLPIIKKEGSSVLLKKQVYSRRKGGGGLLSKQGGGRHPSPIFRREKKKGKPPTKTRSSHQIPRMKKGKKPLLSKIRVRVRVKKGSHHP